MNAQAWVAVLGVAIGTVGALLALIFTMHQKSTRREFDALWEITRENTSNVQRLTVDVVKLTTMLQTLECIRTPRRTAARAETGDTGATGGCG